MRGFSLGQIADYRPRMRGKSMRIDNLSLAWRGVTALGKGTVLRYPSADETAKPQQKTDQCRFPP